MGKVITIPYRPRELQQTIHDNLDKCRFGVIVAHRRFGKTVCVINQLIRAAVESKKERPRYGYIAPFRNQAKQIAWDYFKHYAAPIPGVRLNESELTIDLPNEARIRLFGADNPDALRGLYFDGVVLDEVADMRPEVWGEIVRPALTDRKGFAIFIGTPRGINIFHELYQYALKDPKWYADMFDVERSGQLPAEELEMARGTMSDAQFRQEFLCDFTAAADNVLIPLDLVLESVKKNYPVSAYSGSPTVLGCDPARFGDDKTVITIRQGVMQTALYKYRDKSIPQVAGLVIEKIKEYRPDASFIDINGLGAGVYDVIKDLGYKVQGVDSSKKPQKDKLYYNKRVEMWGRLLEWLQNGGQVIDDLELKADLVSPTYEYDTRNRMKLEKKEKMKERGLPSPDCGDALALTFAQLAVKKPQMQDIDYGNPENYAGYYPGGL
ncbi:MAG: terminase [Deltaproteobacteria bacterium]|nr:terminase [Deltaproteobacteria bacterium]